MVLDTVTENSQCFSDRHANSLKDLEQWIGDVKRHNKIVAFRGQRKYWPLLPSICRGNEKSRVLRDEGVLFEQFKKEAGACLHVSPVSDWDWLVVAQHHGLPTRLLDWTYDPYAAIWFALENSNQNGSEPEVWAIKPYPEDIIISLDNTKPFKGTRTKLFDTTFMIPRIRAQKGCFTLFKYVEKSTRGFVPLEQNKIMQKRIERVRIESFSVGEIRKAIQQMGYSRDRLYPDLDKVARGIRSGLVPHLVSNWVE